MFVVLIKTEINKLYSNLEVLRNFQVMSILNFSMSNLSLGGGKYLNKLIKVQVFQVKRKPKIEFFDENSILGSIQHHPYIPNIIFANNKFYFKTSNLTKKHYNAIFLAKKNKLHPNSEVFLYKNPKILTLTNKNKIDNIIIQLQESDENFELSDIINNDNKLNNIIFKSFDEQIKNNITNYDYVYFEKDLDIIKALNEVKKVID
jgi:hypothetical protein